jgi:dienelactone hydrolase
MSFIDDAEVSDHPIMIFHGVSDDWVPIARCQAYLARLQQNSKNNVKMIALSDASHAYDYPDLPADPTVVKNAQAILCIIVEEPLGTMTNTETKEAFTYSDSCVKRDPHVAYSASATHATE